MYVSRKAGTTRLCIRFSKRSPGPLVSLFFVYFKIDMKISVEWGVVGVCMLMSAPQRRIYAPAPPQSGMAPSGCPTKNSMEVDLDAKFNGFWKREASMYLYILEAIIAFESLQFDFIYLLIIIIYEYICVYF